MVSYLAGDQTKFLSPFLQWQGVGHGKVISSAVHLLDADVEADMYKFRG